MSIYLRAILSCKGDIRQVRVRPKPVEGILNIFFGRGILGEYEEIIFHHTVILLTFDWIELDFVFADNIACIGNTNAVGQTGWEKMKNLSFAQHFTELNNFDFFKFKET